MVNAHAGLEMHQVHQACCIHLSAQKLVQGCPGGVAQEESNGGICHHVPSFTSPGLLCALNATKEMQHEVAISPLQVMKLPWCPLFPNSVASLAVSTTESCYGLCIFKKLGLVLSCSHVDFIARMSSSNVYHVNPLEQMLAEHEAGWHWATSVFMQQSAEAWSVSC